MGFSKNPFLDTYDDPERQQTLLRAPQQTLMKTSPSMKFTLAAGACSWHP